MDLKDRLHEDLKEALKAREKIRLSTIRLLMSEVKYAEIKKHGELDNDELLEVVAREAKRRKEAILEFEKGNRDDLVEKETLELKVLEEYLPEQLSSEELKRIVDEAIRDAGASSPGDLGKVMGKVMPEVRGRADGKQVNVMVREALEKL